MKAIFHRQGWHFLMLGVLVFLLQKFMSNQDLSYQARFLGMQTTSWFWLAVAVPIAHQIYVWLIWRLELHQRTFTRSFGVEKTFSAYSFGFAVLFVGRLILVIILALSDKYSLNVQPMYTFSIAALIAIPVIYLFYSVKMYFTFGRAFGIDHFIEGYSEPYEKRGMFRFTSNGMYVFGLMVLYLPGLLLLSKLALVVALFNHIYIWVHYYCTELPDIRLIY